jgi:CheY-like chemotaxis protein
MNPFFLVNKHILVADDEQFSRQIVMRHLRDFGSPHIEQAASGSDALTVLCDPGKKCDLAILDVNMPGINGLTVLKAIRTGFNGIRRDIPVVMLTGNSDSELISSAMLLDVDAFVVKPASKAGLVQRLEKVLAEAHEVRPVEDYACVPTEERERKVYRKQEEEEAFLAIEARAILLAEAQPGTVLTRDLRTATNAMILPAGVRLTERYLVLLRQLAGMDPSITVVWA